MAPLLVARCRCQVFTQIQSFGLWNRSKTGEWISRWQTIPKRFKAFLTPFLSVSTVRDPKLLSRILLVTSSQATNFALQTWNSPSTATCFVQFDFASFSCLIKMYFCLRTVFLSWAFIVSSIRLASLWKIPWKDSIDVHFFRIISSWRSTKSSTSAHRFSSCRLMASMSRVAASCISLCFWSEFSRIASLSCLKAWYLSLQQVSHLFATFIQFFPDALLGLATGRTVEQLDQNWVNRQFGHSTVRKLAFLLTQRTADHRAIDCLFKAL